MRNHQGRALMLGLNPPENYIKTNFISNGLYCQPFRAKYGMKI